MVFKISGIFLKAILFFILGLLTYQYLPTKIYTFPKATPFTGEYFYNPYEEKNTLWLKGNFHAHAHAWGGLTHGHQAGDIIEEKYRELGYDVPTVSDYFRINKDVNKSDDLYIPVYEHGTDVKKSHRQIIGAKRVDFYDITFQFNMHQKQYLVERMSNSAPVLAINHPGLRKGHSDEVLEKISGYDCLEVLNKSTDYSNYWDAALSSGKAAWLIANDDTHDVLKENNSVGTAWTMLNVAKRTSDEVLKALASGKTYGVQVRNDLTQKDHRKYRAVNENSLQFVKVEGKKYSIQLEKEAEHIRLIGQNGRTKRYFENTDYLEYEIQEEDTYLRAEILNTHTKILLNPIIRYDGIHPPSNTLQSKTHWGYTILFRLSIVIIDFFFIMILIINPIVRKGQKRKKQLTVA